MNGQRRIQRSLVFILGKPTIFILVFAAFGDFAAAVNKSWNLNALGDWSVGGNWTPGGVPNNADNVLIGNVANVENHAVIVDQNVTIAGLEITDGMVLDTDGFTFVVEGNATISGRNTPPGIVAYPSWLRIRPNAGVRAFDVDQLTIEDEALLRLWDGAILEVDES